MSGPDTGGPPSGPKSNPVVLDERLAERIRREVTAWSAGVKGGSAAPLTREQRQDRYRKQTRGGQLTPRQRRRIEHKANRAAVQAA
ncbi:hypothetical protein M3G91_01830 [Micromonospora chalcea]|uniref:hypothetical protein n=1 Tax=Micromonospora chalcea TaxID=1874 RepID=UPI0021A8ACE2|nr:hypothetical protein [Micromonospora chalcea]MCT2276349.1 hypothetical protein [Micromonospora chalcea]